MKIEDKGRYIEQTPETQSDMDFLVERYGASGEFKSWCTPITPPRMRINWKNGTLEEVPIGELRYYR